MIYNMKVYNKAVAMFNNVSFGKRLDNVPNNWWSMTQQEKYFWLYQKLLNEELKK